MRVILFILSVVACVLAEAPYPQPRKPEGALLLLPPEFNKKSEYYTQPSEVEDLGKISEKVMERLRQEQGSGSGSYHVYLNDGRLQKVQYTTAPLKSGQQSPSVQQYKQSQSELNPIIAQFGRFQQELQEKQIQQLQQRQQQLEQQQQVLKQQQEELRSASYLASIRYTNVDPITSPIYSYKSSPVTRILRYAPEYF
nr:zinc finger protein 853-like [Halyomorpha halys]